MKKHGFKLLLGFLFPIITSCKRDFTFLQNGTSIKQDVYSEVYNDSLKVNFQFYGDTKLSLKNEDIKSYKKVSKVCSIKPGQQLIYGKTNIEPFYETFLFYGNELKKNIFYDTLHSESRNYFTRKITKKNEEILEFLFPINSNFLSVIFKAIKLNNVQFDADEIIRKNLVNMSFSVQKVFFNAFKESNVSFFERYYLTPYFIQKKAGKTSRDYQEESIYNQAMATYFSFSSEALKANEFWEMNFPKEKIKIETSTELSNDEFIDQVSDKRLIIINESHHHPENRYFLGQQLKELSLKGFKYLAIEALESIDSLEIRGYPIFNDGFYLRDPVFSNLIRTALALNFKLVKYDDFNSSDRDLQQSANIYNATFKEDSVAKVIVLCGYGHSSEKSTEKSMANYFKTKYKIDPFTINQTYATLKEIEFSQKRNNHKIVVSKDSINYEGNNDLYILNSGNNFETNNCFEDSSSLIDLTFEVPKDVLWDKSLFQFSIYNTNELNAHGLSSIPVYNKIISMENNLITSKMCKGKYTIRCYDSFMNVLIEENIEI